MSGTRIQHDTARNVLVTLMTNKIPLVAPMVCAPCDTTHTYKTYHLRLDEAGSAIVSKGMITALTAAQAFTRGGFSIVNEVEKPPPQRLVISNPADASRRVVLENLERVPVVAQEGS